MERLYNVILEIISDLMMVIFVLVSMLVVLLVVKNFVIRVFEKINQFKNKNVIILFVIANIVLIMLLYSKKILKFLGMEKESCMKEIAEFLNFPYLEQVSYLIFYFIEIICIIIYFIFCKVIAEIIFERINLKYKISESKFRQCVLIIFIVFFIIFFIILVKILGMLLTNYVYKKLAWLWLIFLFRFLFIVLFNFIFLLIFLLFTTAKKTKKYKKDDKSLSKIKNKFSKIITDGANGASIDKLCIDLESISDKDIYKVLKSFNTPSLLGLKYILQQDKERIKFKIREKMKSIVKVTAIAPVLKFLKDSKIFNSNDVINFIESQKNNIKIMVAVIIILICMLLIDNYISKNKVRRIISPNYLLLLIDDILELKKREKKLKKYI